MPQPTPNLSPTSDSSTETTPLVTRGCCFFINFPCFKKTRPNNWERIQTSDFDQNQESVGKNWWDKRATVFKKVREWSEILAGPKWKTFIRRFNNRAEGTKSGNFQYDPMSYALNFDEGQNFNCSGGDDDRVYRDFSSRYAAIRGQSVRLGDDVAVVDAWGGNVGILD